MMGIVVPETCWTYKKYIKIIGSIYLVLILQFFSDIPRFLKHQDYVHFVADVRKMNTGGKILTGESESTHSATSLHCHFIHLSNNDIVIYVIVNT